MHGARGTLTKVAGLFGSEPEKPAPPPVENVVPAPAPPAATSGSEPAPEPAATEEPRKKRGFWGRLFGVGKRDEDDRKPDEQSPRKRKGGL
jgi:hypothetical protein